MPWWTVVLIGIGGVMLGGAWSAYRQEMPAWFFFGLALGGILAIVGGFALIPGDG